MPWQRSNVPTRRSARSLSLVKRGSKLLSGHSVAGFLDGALEVLGGHRTLVVGDLDGALLDVSERALHPGELVQLALDSGLAVAAAHALHAQCLFGHHFSFLRNDERLNPQEPLDGCGELFY